MGITLVIPNPCGTIRGLRGRSPLGEGEAENAKGGCSEGDSSPYIQRKLPAEARSVSKSVLQNNGLLRLRLAMTFCERPYYFARSR